VKPRQVFHNRFAPKPLESASCSNLVLPPFFAARTHCSSGREMGKEASAAGAYGC
jgi:hypothetical protein